MATTDRTEAYSAPGEIIAEPAALPLLRELAAIAGTGLGFARDPYDRERYERLAVLARALIAAGTGLPEGEVALAIENRVGYVTPKIDVRGGVIRDGRILLVREASDGRWSLPGGYADVNLSPAQAIEAEIAQESGFTAAADKLVGLWDRRRHHPGHPQLLHCYKMFFLCRATGGAAATSLETTEIGWFAEDALPELSLGRCTPWQIGRLFAHHREPGLPTEFD